MRYAAGAFKAALSPAVLPAAKIRVGMRATLAAAALFLQGCAIFDAKPDPDLLAQNAAELDAAKARSTDLQSEVDRLASENAALKAQVEALEKKAIRLAAADTPPPVKQTGESPLKDGPSAEIAATETARPSTAPAAPVVDAPNADVSLPGAPVPIDNAPRLVQPSFASSEQIFENEASSPEIKMSSVLWGVHLASYKLRDDASAGWAKLQRENPDELGLLEPRIEKVNVEGRGEYLRLVGGGFSSREKAKALCDRLQTKGVFCRIATFGGDRLSMLDVGQIR